MLCVELERGNGKNAQHTQGEQGLIFRGLNLIIPTTPILSLEWGEDPPKPPSWRKRGKFCPYNGGRIPLIPPLGVGGKICPRMGGPSRCSFCDLNFPPFFLVFHPKMHPLQLPLHQNILLSFPDMPKHLILTPHAVYTQFLAEKRPFFDLFWGPKNSAISKKNIS